MREKKKSSKKLTFIILPGVCVRPIDQFLVYPRQKASGRVGEAVTDRLRLCGLFHEVAHLFVPEGSRSRQPRFLRRGVPREQICDIYAWIGKELGRSSDVKIDSVNIVEHDQNFEILTGLLLELLGSYAMLYCAWLRISWRSAS